MLTKRQYNVMTVLYRMMRTMDGRTPNYRQLKEALNVKHASEVHRHLVDLIEAGYLRRLYGYPLSLEILRLPSLDEIHARKPAYSAPRKSKKWKRVGRRPSALTHYNVGLSY